MLALRWVPKAGMVEAGMVHGIGMVEAAAVRRAGAQEGGQDGGWSVEVGRSSGGEEGKGEEGWGEERRGEEGRGGEGTCDILSADALWLATGHRLDASKVAVLSSLRRCRPQQEHDGLPELTPSLRWDASTPLYVAGALAALQVRSAQGLGRLGVRVRSG